MGIRAPTPNTIVELAKALGYVQIDTLIVVNRAHYITLWERFGSYDIDNFHSMQFIQVQHQVITRLKSLRRLSLMPMPVLPGGSSPWTRGALAIVLKNPGQRKLLL